MKIQPKLSHQMTMNKSITMMMLKIQDSKSIHISSLSTLWQDFQMMKMTWFFIGVWADKRLERGVLQIKGSIHQILKDGQMVLLLKLSLAESLKTAVLELWLLLSSGKRRSTLQSIPFATFWPKNPKMSGIQLMAEIKESWCAHKKKKRLKTMEMDSLVFLKDQSVKSLQKFLTVSANTTLGLSCIDITKSVIFSNVVKWIPQAEITLSFSIFG